MIVLSSGHVQSVSAPPISPVERPIDLEHLSRMTLGEPSLEQEVLQLFDRQAGMLMRRMRTAAAPVAAASAHTLKGSALGIGAWEVARAAEAVEFAAGANEAEVSHEIDRLQACVAEVRAVIAELLRAH
jgi:HPt (histidine-containing phosphotransfer) domain-containing protein